MRGWITAYGAMHVNIGNITSDDLILPVRFDHLNNCFTKKYDVNWVLHHVIKGLSNTTYAKASPSL